MSRFRTEFASCVTFCRRKVQCADCRCFESEGADFLAITTPKGIFTFVSSRQCVYVQVFPLLPFPFHNLTPRSGYAPLLSPAPCIFQRCVVDVDKFCLFYIFHILTAQCRHRQMFSLPCNCNSNVLLILFLQHPVDPNSALQI